MAPYPKITNYKTSSHKASIYRRVTLKLNFSRGVSTKPAAWYFNSPFLKCSSVKLILYLLIRRNSPRIVWIFPILAPMHFLLKKITQKLVWKECGIEIPKTVSFDQLYSSVNPNVSKFDQKVLLRWPRDTVFQGTPNNFFFFEKKKWLPRSNLPGITILI